MEKVCKNCRFWHKTDVFNGWCAEVDRRVFMPTKQTDLWTPDDFGCVLFKEEECRPFNARFEEGADGWCVIFRNVLGDERSFAPEKGLHEVTAKLWSAWLNSVWRKEKDDDGEDLQEL